MSDTNTRETNQSEDQRADLGFWQKIRRRKLKNYLFLDKQIQFHFASILAGVGIISFLYFSTIIYFYHHELQFRMSTMIPDYVLTNQVFEDNMRLLSTTILFVGIFQVILVVLLALFGLSFSHRIAGPLYGIALKLKGIAKGTKPARITLRKNDLLTDFAESFNGAMDNLTNQRGVLESAYSEAKSGNAKACEELLKKMLDAPSSDPNEIQA